ncbi:MAG: hypothetical protein PHN72_06070 [Bacilli bacterium]|nr:hypothetical protein [Bacilli bacterium]
MVIDDIKNGIDANPNLTEEVKSDMLWLIALLHKYYPEMSLDVLKERIKTVNVEVVGKFISNEAVFYNENTNVLQINKTELEKANDLKHILMVAILYMIPKQQSENNIMDGFKKGFAELVANSLVGSETYES